MIENLFIGLGAMVVCLAIQALLVVVAIQVYANRRRLAASPTMVGTFVLICAVMVVLVVGNTLRLAVEARRSEIEVEKLFGASDAFVRRPFLYHGVVYGMAGALLALAIISLGLMLLAPPVRELMGLYGGALAIQPPSAAHALLLLAAGPILGWLGSWLSVTRHLKKIEPR